MAGADECNIKVICRIRPLNQSEEKAGSKFVLKFPTDDSVSVAVSKYGRDLLISGWLQRWWSFIDELYACAWRHALVRQTGFLHIDYHKLRRRRPDDAFWFISIINLSHQFQLPPSIQMWMWTICLFSKHVKGVFYVNSTSSWYIIVTKGHVKNSVYSICTCTQIGTILGIGMV